MKTDTELNSGTFQISQYDNVTLMGLMGGVGPFCVEFFIFPVSAWVSPVSFSFFPQFKDMYVR